ncbi:MAG: hypothetical protein L6R41_003816 [Letrouitia leprolyta]|nr:MAG: hypothetical protein L6R41_003816 [Letrouitia leprolyta]
MEEGKGGPQSHVQEVGSERPKRGFGAKLKAHYKKWWWLHLIFFIASTLIIVLCLVYVAFPRISQDGVDDSTLEIKDLVFTDPTPDSFHIQQTALLTNHNNYHPRLDAFNASLAVGGSEDRIFAYVELPAVHATEHATTHIDQEVNVIDLDAFTDYNTQLWTNKSVELVVKGRTKLHEMKFPTTTVDFHKRIDMKGFEGIPGFNVTEFSIKLVPEPDGANMIGTVYIPNPTVLTLTMGNVTFNNFVDDEFIGTSVLSDLVLKPGNNTVPMRSMVNQTLVIEKVTGTYKDGMLPIEVRSNSSIYNGQHLEYFEKALQGSQQHIVLNVGAALAALTGGSAPPG